MEFIMVIIAFAPKSSKILPNLLCRKFRHCAVIIRKENGFTMYQFVSHKKVKRISLHQRDITILGRNGWRFVYIPCMLRHNFNPAIAWSCVDMAKRAIGLKSFWIQTPYDLYKRISN